MDEWAAAYVACASATFFHGPRWSRIVAEYTRGLHRPDPLLVELDDGSSAILGITTSPTPLPGVRRRLLSPLGCTGGWVSPSPLTGEAMSVLASTVCRGEVIWRVGPADDLIPDAALAGAHDEVTHIVDLRDGSEAARASWKPSARRRVGRAERAGVTVRAGGTPDDWDAYRRLYRRTQERWDAPLSVNEDHLFEIIPRVAEGEALLVLAERDGEACAGTVVFLHERHASGWHAASDTRDPPGSFNAVVWHLLEMLECRGVETLDMLGSGGLEGVVAFKESIGGIPHRVRTVVCSHPLMTAARATRRVALVRR